MAELLERWPAAVGEAIARNAWPARIARDGTVHVSTADSVWAFELGHRSGEIAGRLGVERLRFAPGPLPEATLEETVERRFADARGARRGAPDRRGESTDEKVRESVQKAVSFSLARERADHRL